MPLRFDAVWAWIGEDGKPVVERARVVGWMTQVQSRYTWADVVRVPWDDDDTVSERRVVPAVLDGWSVFALGEGSEPGPPWLVIPAEQPDPSADEVAAHVAHEAWLNECREVQRAASDARNRCAEKSRQEQARRPAESLVTS